MEIENLLKKHQKLLKLFKTFPFLVPIALKLPKLRTIVETETKKIQDKFKNITKSYSLYKTFRKLPEKGIPKKKLLKFFLEIQAKENKKWEKGFVSGAVYHGERSHIDFLNQVYSIFSQSNPLHSDLWPSITKFESQIISMCADLLNGNVDVINDNKVCGSVTSGGTESILLAMKTYRDWAYYERKIKIPEIILPVTAHAAFYKASEYFKIRVKKIPVDNNQKAIPKEIKKSITKNTIAIVGSAPSFAHGVIDPIEEMSEYAYREGIGFHTDACLGGFILPFAETLGYKIPKFDFRLRGVTSISIDTHKYGYASKGTSVILYRSEDLRKYQFFAISDWPGGLYASPTFAGSRPGGLSASCYASLLSIGRKGYLKYTKKILETALEFKKAIEDIPELKLIGDPIWILSFTSDQINIYRVWEEMNKRQWNLNALQHPPAIHIAITLRHTKKGIVKKFIKDLKDSLQYVKKHPQEEYDLAPMYGIANGIPAHGLVNDLLKKYLDSLYRI